MNICVCLPTLAEKHQMQLLRVTWVSISAYIEELGTSIASPSLKQHSAPYYCQSSF